MNRKTKTTLQLIICTWHVKDLFPAP